MPLSSHRSNASKFTRGEKCIFAHVVITFAGILAVVVVYLAHACVVRHRGDGALALERAAAPAAADARRSPEPRAPADSAYQCVGAAYVRAGAGERAACGVAAVHARWALAPARCVAARAHPHLAHLLPHWTLRYPLHHTGVRRGVANPQFARDAAADVGLLEHERALPLAARSALVCAVPSGPERDLTDVFIVGRRAEGGLAAAAVSALPAARCEALSEPVARASLCLAPRQHADRHLPDPLLGAAVFSGLRLVALASWGGADARTGLSAAVAVPLAPYAHWLETTMMIL